MPGLIGGFGNIFVPLLIGAKIYLSSILLLNRFIYSNYIYLIIVKIKIIFNNSFFNDKSNNNNWENKAFYYINKEEKENKFNSYLAGLFEGDGHIIIEKKKSNKKKISIGITFNIKDLPLCEYLKLKLNYGWIRIKEKENACVLIFYTDKGIIKFVETINGYLRTPKLYKFNIIIDYLNEKYSLNLLKYNEDTSELGSNNWFAGYIDADGGFYIRYTKTSKLRIACVLRIEQRMIDPISKLTYESLFLKIANFLFTKLEITKHKEKNYYLVKGSSRISLNQIINYFDKFSLYSSKYLDYNNWNKATKFLLNKTAYLVENRDEIYKLKNSMNNKRIIFNWDHLKNL